MSAKGRRGFARRRAMRVLVGRVLVEQGPDEFWKHPYNSAVESQSDTQSRLLFSEGVASLGRNRN